MTETTAKSKESYLGLTDNELKTRYNLPRSLFKLVPRKKDTKLSEHILELKDKNIEHTIQWEMIKEKPSHILQKKVYAHFVWKKASNFDQSFLSEQKKGDLSHCVHRKLFLLSNVKTNHRSLSTARAPNSGVMENQI